MTKKPFAFCLLIALLWFQTAAFAQRSAATKWLEEINRDIWIPFLAGVEKNDDSLYLTVHSRDYIRVQAEGRLILSYATYVDDTRTMMRGYKDRGTGLIMHVRFEERITNGQFASERGISRVVFSSKKGERRVYYSRFHTISRKENGVWKILTDHYPPADERVGEQEFNRAHEMGDVHPFRCYLLYPNKKQDCGK